MPRAMGEILCPGVAPAAIRRALRGLLEGRRMGRDSSRPPPALHRQYPGKAGHFARRGRARGTLTGCFS